MVQEELQDTAGVYFTTAKVREFLNKGMAEFCERTRLRRETVSLNVTGNDATVDLSTTTPRILEPIRFSLPIAEDSTSEFELDYIGLDALERMDSQWRDRTGVPTHVVRWDQGNLSVRLWPTPTTTYSTFAVTDTAVHFDSLYGGIGSIAGIGTTEFDSLYGELADATGLYGGLRVDYIAGSTDMSADGDTPTSTSEIPPEYHEALAHYACYRCLEMETELKQVQRAQVYRERWENACVLAGRKTQQVFQARPKRTQGYREF